MLLEIKDLKVGFSTLRGPMQAINGIDLHVTAGESLGIVGESGCGKSLTSLAVMGLLPDTAKVTAERLSFNDRNLLKASAGERRRLRGSDMAMIFQDPMSALNPSFTVGFQMDQLLKLHERLTRHERRRRSIELLNKVGIPDPESQLHVYPHQLSGGMCQRVMIAMAISSNPRLLIADEPTTALDVTIQAQILALLREIQSEENMALILITHDLGVVAQMADRVGVMYAGEIVEQGTATQVIHHPRHPYTEGLLACLPETHGDQFMEALPTIPGLVPDLVHRPSGCQLHPRCSYADHICQQHTPVVSDAGEHRAWCHKPLGGQS